MDPSSSPSSSGPFDEPTTAPEPVVTARGIVKSFQIGSRELMILHGIDLDLVPGERLGLVGASGAGKSTLLHSLGLLERPTEGSVHVEGISAWDLPPVARAAMRNQKLGFVFQTYHLLPELSSVENVILPGMIEARGFGARRRKKELIERASHLLGTFGLADRLKHRPARLSGGERQRVAIARALILDPPVLIADEPTGNLDSTTSGKILELLLEEQRRRGLALLLVTHDAHVAEGCDRVLTMVDGRLVNGSPGPEPAPEGEPAVADSAPGTEA